MAFFLTLVYLCLTFLSPDEIMPALAPYRPLLIVTVIVVLCSLPELASAPPSVRSRQFSLVGWFTVIALLSNAFHLWFGGVLDSTLDLLPNVIVFFLLLLHMNTTRKLGIAMTAVWFVAVFLAIQGMIALFTGVGAEKFLYTDYVWKGDVAVSVIKRIRASGFLADPNDLAQFFEVVLPFPWLLWKKKQAFRNFFLVLLPTAFLVYSIFLTHSRGSLLGLAVILLFALRSRLGTVSSGILTFLGILGATAMNFTGGRGMSAADGADRLDAWSAGLDMLRSSPLFGVGYSRFTDFNHITAHNSFVLCLAELGMVGTWFWVGIIVSVFVGLHRYTAKRGAATPVTEEEGSAAPALLHEGSVAEGASPGTAVAPQIAEALLEDSFQDAPINIPHWAGVMRASMLGFVVTAWFISRAYKTTFFLAIGVVSAFILIADQQSGNGQEGSQNPGEDKWFRLTTMVEIGALIFVYLSVRLGE